MAHFQRKEIHARVHTLAHKHAYKCTYLHTLFKSIEKKSPFVGSKLMIGSSRCYTNTLQYATFDALSQPWQQLFHYYQVFPLCQYNI